MPQHEKIYLDVLTKLFKDENSILPDDLSWLKGMVNRCCRHDKWDWLTTYIYLGYPDYKTMNSFVSEIVDLRVEIKNRDYSHLNDFKNKYANLLYSMYTHLSSDLSYARIDIEIPPTNISNTIWEKLSEDSKRNLLFLEGVEKKNSVFFLMHYFVTLEQEFLFNLVQPFVNNKSKNYSNNKVPEKYKQTIEILIGKTHFSLGSIKYLSKYIGNSNERNSNQLFGMFANYLGNDINEFVKICDAISYEKINGYSLISLRNGLSHGDYSITKSIGISEQKWVKDMILSKPFNLLERILLISKKLPPRDPS